MSNPMKHVGKIGEKPCVVLYREVPGEPDNALIVKTHSLTDSQHDVLMGVVQSTEAQQANDVAEVFNRRQFQDGTNILQTLHFEKKIEKVPVNLVSLTPTPSQSVLLSEVNAEIRKIQNNSNPPLKTDPASVRQTTPQVNEPVTIQPPLESDTVLAEGATTVASEADEAQIANNLLQQALILEDDANALLRDAEAKKQEAYRLNPDLAPKKGPGRPRKESA